MRTIQPVRRVYFEKSLLLAEGELRKITNKNCMGLGIRLPAVDSGGEPYYKYDSLYLYGFVKYKYKNFKEKLQTQLDMDVTFENEVEFDEFLSNAAVYSRAWHNFSVVHLYKVKKDDFDFINSVRRVLNDDSLKNCTIKGTDVVPYINSDSEYTNLYYTLVDTHQAKKCYNLLKESLFEGQEAPPVRLASPLTLNHNKSYFKRYNTFNENLSKTRYYMVLEDLSSDFQMNEIGKLIDVRKILNFQLHDKDECESGKKSLTISVSGQENADDVHRKLSNKYQVVKLY